MGLTRTRKMRSLVVGMIFVVFLAAVVVRLFWIQTVDASFLRDRAEKTWEQNEVIKPERGMITDRNGKTLVEETDAYIIAADLSQVKNPKQTAEKLAPLMKMPKEVIYNRLTKKDVDQVELRDGGHFKMSRKTKNRIMNLDLDGIYAIRTSDRNYLEGKLAAHVLGFVNEAGKAAGGVEHQYDKLLRGKAGALRFKQDAYGNKVPNGTEKFHPPDQGKDLVLTLDSRIQYQVERILDRVTAQHRAKGATAIVADPRTGEVLAMANRPSFNPDQYRTTWKAGSNDTNTAVSSQYEPGSTFKIVTLAAAIEEGKFDPDKRFQSGSIEVGEKTIRDWNDWGWGEISYAEGIYLSSNVAFVRLAEKLGAEKLIRYIERFGFGRITEQTGQPTGIDLPAEGRGYFFGHEPLHELELASTAFGQGIAVTPIQQVMAVSAIANGGTLYRPHVLKEVLEPDSDRAIKKVKPYKIRSGVVSPQTARQVRELLRGVVVQGTGKKADVPGYPVAGKTGTAQKPKTDGQGYASGQYMVSFIGFSPADNPRVVVYVAVDEPQDSSHGGTVAAPAAREIIKDSLRLMGVKSRSSNGKKEKRTDTDPSAAIAGDWVKKSVDEVKEKLKETDIQVEVLGGGKEVSAQYPTPGAQITHGRVYLLTESSKSVSMPDLRGKSLREAMDLCRLLELNPQVDGEGYVDSQSIPPGDRIMDKKEIQLRLQSDPPS
ncbi:penicillin-binding protein [Paludifilum halophilum]|uniref:penicillin-binding protein n=1 Tax=Paludifilum halophilum TaxID=1642702 RepID=UPI001140076B|nr:PASTA domain-containing penicillin-binding protein [Paludifilum halophilum]